MNDFFKAMTLDNDRAWFYFDKEKFPGIAVQVLYFGCKLAKRRRKVFDNKLQQEKKSKILAKAKKGKQNNTNEESLSISSAMDLVLNQVDIQNDSRLIPSVLITNFKGMDSFLIALGVAEPKEGKIVFTESNASKIFTHLYNNGCQDIFDRIHFFSQDRSNYSSFDEEQDKKDQLTYDLPDDEGGLSEPLLQVEEEKNS